MSIYQFTAKVTYQSNTQMRNIHYYEFFNYVPTTSQVQEAVDAISEAYRTNLQGDFPNDLSFDGLDVRRVDIGDQPTIPYTPTGGAWVGTSGVDPLPSQVSAVVSFRGLTAFPRNARTFMFPFPEGVNDSTGKVLPALVTALEDWGDDMLSLSITGDVDADKQAVRFGGDPRVVTDANDVTSVTVSNVWGTQRRRRLGVGV